MRRRYTSSKHDAYFIEQGVTIRDSWLSAFPTLDLPIQMFFSSHNQV